MRRKKRKGREERRAGCLAGWTREERLGLEDRALEGGSNREEGRKGGREGGREEREGKGRGEDERRWSERFWQDIMRKELKRFAGLLLNDAMIETDAMEYFLPPPSTSFSLSSSPPLLLFDLLFLVVPVLLSSCTSSCLPLARISVPPSAYLTLSLTSPTFSCPLLLSSSPPIDVVPPYLFPPYLREDEESFSVSEGFAPSPCTRS
eukprot:765758-Hanusia_phi.AAC.1